jgi:iron(III) transport system substrate-binding protein
VVVPDQAPDQIGAAWNMAGIAISRHTKRVGEAEKLIAFLVSAPGQKIFAEVNQEYPVRPGIPLAAGVPKIDNVRVTRTPIEEIGRQREVTISEIQRLGLQ